MFNSSSARILRRVTERPDAVVAWSPTLGWMSERVTRAEAVVAEAEAAAARRAAR